MSAALLTVTVLCVAANALIAVADFAGARFVLANSAEVGLSPRALPYLATLKLAGAVGLVAGLAGADRIGLAAGAGLVLFFVGAVIAHLRAGVLHNIAFPGLYLLSAVGAVAYFAMAT